jgi:hypothetical protein
VRVWGLTVVAVFVPLGRFLLFVASVRGAAFAARGVGYLVLAFGISFAGDVSYIVLTRWLLRRISRIDRVYEIALVIAGNLLILFILLVAPISIGIRVFHYAHTIAEVVVFSFVLNSINFAVGSAALVLAVLLLIHRLLWPVIERPLYAIQRFGLISNKKLLWPIGLALITLPTQTSLGWVKSLLEKLG